MELTNFLPGRMEIAATAGELIIRDYPHVPSIEIYYKGQTLLLGGDGIALSTDSQPQDIQANPPFEKVEARQRQAMEDAVAQRLTCNRILTLEKEVERLRKLVQPIEEHQDQEAGAKAQKRLKDGRMYLIMLVFSEQTIVACYRNRTFWIDDVPLCGVATIKSITTLTGDEVEPFE